LEDGRRAHRACPSVRRRWRRCRAAPRCRVRRTRPPSGRRVLRAAGHHCVFEPSTFVFRPSFRVHPRRNRRQVHILARVPILPLCAAPAKALFCPYWSFSRASMVLQDAAMQRITFREQTTAYCTYGWMLSVAMEKHADGLEPERQISSSRRPKEWRSLMAVETRQRCKRSHARIREQWCSHV